MISMEALLIEVKAIAFLAHLMVLLMLIKHQWHDSVFIYSACLLLRPNPPSNPSLELLIFRALNLYSSSCPRASTVLVLLPAPLDLHRIT